MYSLSLEIKRERERQRDRETERQTERDRQHYWGRGSERGKEIHKQVPHCEHGA